MYVYFYLYYYYSFSNSIFYVSIVSGSGWWLSTKFNRTLLRSSAESEPTQYFTASVVKRNTADSGIPCSSGVGGTETQLHSAAAKVSTDLTVYSESFRCIIVSCDTSHMCLSSKGANQQASREGHRQGVLSALPRPARIRILGLLTLAADIVL